jgi:hypothetical protein
MQMFLYKDILPAWDEQQKQTTTVSIEAIYLMATSPANDPLVFLRSSAENNPTANTLLADAFKHMRSVLVLETCTWDQLFGTDCTGAAEATSESRMLEGFFRFCNDKSLFNVQLGGIRMDVKDKVEMDVWNKYIQHVIEDRKSHYRLLIKETLHDCSNWPRASACAQQQHGLGFLPRPNILADQLRAHRAGDRGVHCHVLQRRLRSRNERLAERLDMVPL